MRRPPLMKVRPFLLAALVALAALGPLASPETAFADGGAPLTPRLAITKDATATLARPALTDMNARYATLFAKARPTARAKIGLAARALITDMTAAQERDRKLAATVGAKTKPKPYDTVAGAKAQILGQKNFGLGTLSDGDIMELCYIVLMEATSDAQNDLKSIMAATEAADKAKGFVRQTDAAIRAGVATPGLGQADLTAIVDAAKNSLDSVSELSETESLRLQMAMDRVSKFMQTISNLEKKDDDTVTSIIKNMK